MNSIFEFIFIVLNLSISDKYAQKNSDVYALASNEDSDEPAQMWRLTRGFSHTESMEEAEGSDHVRIGV